MKFSFVVGLLVLLGLLVQPVAAQRSGNDDIYTDPVCYEVMGPARAYVESMIADPDIGYDAIMEDVQILHQLIPDYLELQRGSVQHPLYDLCYGSTYQGMLLLREFRIYYPLTEANYVGRLTYMLKWMPAGMPIVLKGD